MIPNAGRKTALVGLLTVVSITADARKVYEGYGWCLTAIPVVNFSSDDGTSFGMRVNLCEYDGESISYRRKCSTQAFATIGGKWIHRLLLDAPYIRSSERLEAEQVFGDIGQIFAHNPLPRRPVPGQRVGSALPLAQYYSVG